MKKAGRQVKKIPYAVINPECRDEKVLAALGLDEWKPVHKTAGSACADFRAADTLVIPKHTVRAVKTGIKVALPEGFELAARSRSGLFVNHQIFIMGTIDDDYRGEMKILLANFGDEDFQINFGDRIGQFKLSKFYIQDYNLCNEDELPDTERGQGGLGSTGVK